MTRRAPGPPAGPRPRPGLAARPRPVAVAGAPCGARRPGDVAARARAARHVRAAGRRDGRVLVGRLAGLEPARPAGPACVDTRADRCRRGRPDHARPGRGRTARPARDLRPAPGPRHPPTFPATMPLAGAAFVAMLQLTLVCEGWPLRRLGRFTAGLAALARLAGSSRSSSTARRRLPRAARLRARRRDGPLSGGARGAPRAGRRLAGAGSTSPGAAGRSRRSTAARLRLARGQRGRARRRRLTYVVVPRVGRRRRRPRSAPPPARSSRPACSSGMLFEGWLSAPPPAGAAATLAAVVALAAPLYAGAAAPTPTRRLDPGRRGGVGRARRPQRDRRRGDPARRHRPALAVRRRAAALHQRLERRDPLAPERLHPLGASPASASRSCASAAVLFASPLASKTTTTRERAVAPVEARRPRPRRGALAEPALRAASARAATRRRTRRRAARPARPPSSRP